MAIHSLSWAAPNNITSFYTSRTGGFSKPPYESFNLAQHVADDKESVLRNRELLESLTPGATSWQWLDQVHGSEVLIIDDASKQSSQPVTADGIVCRVPGTVCCILTADCLPVFFADRQGKEVAIAHAGWRGLAGGILEKTVLAMNTASKDVLAFLGPAIGPCHFEVGAEVLEAFLSQQSEHDGKLETRKCFEEIQSGELVEQKYLADLYSLARQKLYRLGIAEISGGADCTFCQQEAFFSYRRDGEMGRMLNAIFFE